MGGEIVRKAYPGSRSPLGHETRIIQEKDEGGGTRGHGRSAHVSFVRWPRTGGAQFQVLDPRVGINKGNLRPEFRDKRAVGDGRSTLVEVSKIFRRSRWYNLQFINSGEETGRT